MKIVMVDVDGVLNTESSLRKRALNETGIDPYRVVLLHRILEATGAKVVVSSSWRLYPKSLEHVKKACTPHFLDVTPNPPGKSRGEKITHWLEDHPEVERYAVLDDDADAGIGHDGNFFQTNFYKDGLNEEIAEKIIKHLNNKK